MVYSPDGTKIASGSGDNTVKIWNAQTGQCVSTLVDSTVNSVAFCPDGSKIAAAYSSKIQIFDAKTMAKLGSPLSVDYTVNSVAFSPDGSKIAAANRNEIQIFDTQTQAKLGSPLSGHSEEE